MVTILFLISVWQQRWAGLASPSFIFLSRLSWGGNLKLENSILISLGFSCLGNSHAKLILWTILWPRSVLDGPIDLEMASGLIRKEIRKKWKIQIFFFFNLSASQLYTICDLCLRLISVPTGFKSMKNLLNIKKFFAFAHLFLLCTMYVYRDINKHYTCRLSGTGWFYSLWSTRPYSLPT